MQIKNNYINKKKLKKRQIRGKKDEYGENIRNRVFLPVRRKTTNGKKTQRGK